MEALQHALSMQQLELVCGNADTDPAATVSSVLQHCAVLIDKGGAEAEMGSQVKMLGTGCTRQ